MEDERHGKIDSVLKTAIEEEDPHAHHFYMPRFGSCLSKRRTVIHTLSAGDFPYSVGDRLLLHPTPHFPRAMVAHIVQVCEVHLQDVFETDIAGLDVGPEEYSRNWDLNWPEAPVSSNPLVTRIVFAYGEPPMSA
jgi:hypothetical protein